MCNRPDDAATWRIALTLPQHALDSVVEVLQEYAGAVYTHPLEQCTKIDWTHEESWQLIAYCNNASQGGVLAVLAIETLAGLGLSSQEINIEAVPKIDWAAQDTQKFPLLFAGRFVVHGDHLRPPPGRVALCVNAANAFGSGRHGSTLGCLLALDRVANQRRVARALDLGTGSGILATAIARCWFGGGMGEAAVLATDIDPAAIAVASRVVEANSVAARVRCVLSDNFAAPEISTGAPYDLICANILADPLRRMAPDLSEHLALDGMAILSGILVSQEEEVMESYIRVGLRRADHIRIGEWSSLLLTW